MKLHTMNLRAADGRWLDSVRYAPLIFTRGTQSHRLALHQRTGADRWRVSHPESGALILRVTATHKGVPVSTACLGLRDARQCALADLNGLVDRIGIERFESTLAAAVAMAVGAPI